MSLEVRRQERETSQSLIRRFSRIVRQSGILVQARKNRYKRKPKSGQMQRRAALRREELKIQYEKQKKLSRPEERERENR